jgi:hypothetical protein
MSLSGQSDSSLKLPKPQIRRGSPQQRPRAAAVEAAATIAWAMTPLIVAAVAALA